MGQNNINSSEMAEIFMLQFLCAEIVILILAVFFFTFFVNKHLIKEALSETWTHIQARLDNNTTQDIINTNLTENELINREILINPVHIWYHIDK